jgi:ribosomal protein S4
VVQRKQVFKDAAAGESIDTENKPEEKKQKETGNERR